MAWVSPVLPVFHQETLKVDFVFVCVSMADQIGNENTPLQGKLDTISLDDGPPLGVTSDPNRPSEDHIGHIGAMYPADETNDVIEPGPPMVRSDNPDEEIYPTYQSGGGNDDPLAFVQGDGNFFYKYPIHRYSSIFSSFVVSGAAIWFMLIMCLYCFLLVVQFFIQLFEGSNERWGLPGVIVGNMIYIVALGCGAFGTASVISALLANFFWKKYEFVTLMGCLFEFAMISFGVLLIASRLFPVFVDIIFQVGFWGNAGYTFEGSLFFLIIPGFCCCVCVWPCIIFGCIYIGFGIFGIVGENQYQKAGGTEF